jgi:FKBP-type peptidyl-prolyl cis-trans isomerase
MKLYSGIIRILIFVSLVLMATGCLKSEWAEKEQHENEVIQNYLDANGITEDQKTEGGIYYIEEVAGTGAAPIKDDFVVIGFTGRYLETNEIHETSFDSLKDEWEGAAVYTDYVYGPVKFQFGYSIEGINEGLSLMKEGGKSELVIPSYKAFYDFKPLVYEMNLIKVITDPVAFEDSLLGEYIALKGFDTTSYLDSVMFYDETFTPDPNDDHYVQSGDTVFFRFTGRLVDGFGDEIRDNRVFDSNLNDELPVRITYPSTKPSSGSILAIPPGLITALGVMRSGTRATVILPYVQAFKDVGLFNTTYGYTVVPRYQTVVYDLNVEEIRSPVK